MDENDRDGVRRGRRGRALRKRKKRQRKSLEGRKRNVRQDEYSPGRGLLFDFPGG
jgi:hypothetical protein